MDGCGRLGAPPRPAGRRSVDFSVAFPRNSSSSFALLRSTQRPPPDIDAISGSHVMAPVARHSDHVIAQPQLGTRKMSVSHAFHADAFGILLH